MTQNSKDNSPYLPPPGKKIFWRSFFLGLGLGLLLGIGLGWGIKKSCGRPATSKNVQRESLQSGFGSKIFSLWGRLFKEKEAPPPILKPALPFWIKSKISKGEGMFPALLRLGATGPQALQIINALRDSVEIDAVLPGQNIGLRFAADSQKILTFEYQTSPILFHYLTFKDSILSYSAKKLKTDTLYRLIQGHLQAGSSLDAQLGKTGIDPAMVQTAGNILSCKIAFRTEARVGDKYQVFLRETRYKGTLVDTWILFAEYQGVKTGKHQAFRYTDPDPKSSYNAHYTPSGEALIHSGLRYPIDRLHISSGYGMRIHPVTGRLTAHQGVDYSAATGTPVYAVAPGLVVESGYDPLSGNKIAIRHNDGYTSYYLHLNTKSAGTGQRVTARQKIGTVGATGRVTGPHLHFGFKTPQGTWMNPLNKRMIATPKLSGTRLVHLKKQIEEILSLYKHTKQKTKTS